MSEPRSIADPETGFLETRLKYKSEYKPFTSDKKVQFLQLARQRIKNTRKLPDITSICKLLSVEHASFYQHLNKDEAFAREWENVLKESMDVYTSKLADKADTKQGTIANLAILKWLESRRWNQESKIIINTETRQLKTVIDAELVNNVDNTYQISESKVNSSIELPISTTDNKP